MKVNLSSKSSRGIFHLYVTRTEMDTIKKLKVVQSKILDIIKNNTDSQTKLIYSAALLEIEPLNKQSTNLQMVIKTNLKHLNPNFFKDKPLLEFEIIGNRLLRFHTDSRPVSYRLELNPPPGQEGLFENRRGDVIGDVNANRAKFELIWVNKKVDKRGITGDLNMALSKKPDRNSRKKSSIYYISEKTGERKKEIIIWRRTGTSPKSPYAWFWAASEFKNKFKHLLDGRVEVL